MQPEAFIAGSRAVQAIGIEHEIGDRREQTEQPDRRRQRQQHWTAYSSERGQQQGQQRVEKEFTGDRPRWRVPAQSGLRDPRLLVIDDAVDKHEAREHKKQGDRRGSIGDEACKRVAGIDDEGAKRVVEHHVQRSDEAQTGERRKKRR